MKVVKSPEGEWMFDEGPHLVSMSCHHKAKRRRPHSACGGCYARAIRLIEELAVSGNQKAQTLVAALKAEAEERKR